MSGSTAATAAPVPGPVQALDRDLALARAAEAEITSSKAPPRWVSAVLFLFFFIHDRH